MNSRHHIACAALAAWTWFACAGKAPAGDLVSIGLDSGSGCSQAVIIDRRSPLVFTEQILPYDERAQVPEDANGQIQVLFQRLGRTLSAAETSPERLAKLNFYVATASVAERVRGKLAKWREGAAVLPAVSYVESRMPDPRAMVAVDAVATTGVAAYERYARQWNKDYRAAKERAGVVAEPESYRPNRFSILAQLPLVFVSGQSEPGDLPAATTATLGSLDATLKSLSLDRSHVAQVKCFLQPMTRAAEVMQRIKAYFAPYPTPPVVLVEWTMKLPIEIELVAYKRPARSDANVSFFTPPGMKPSNVFSRVAEVNAAKLIYISGLYSTSEGDGAVQVRGIFEELGKVLSQTDSDFRHLAKATYYVTDDDASKALNALRPQYYDPARPPAASKATVEGVAKSQCTITLDMIAVERSHGAAGAKK